MINNKIEELKQIDPEKNHNISERYNLWISNISEENRYVFEKIFCDIKYYSEKELRILLQKLYNSIKKTNTFIDDTLILTIDSQPSKYNSSIYMTSFLVQANNIASNYCTIEEMKKNKYNPTNIILCDDFIGTGGTIIDFIKHNLKVFKNKNIYLLCIHCMDVGLNNICSYAKANDINIYIKKFVEQKKYLSELNNELLNPYLIECKTLNIKNPLGYGNSEALIVTYNNTPNNTLSAIWQNTKTNCAIFPRRKTKIPKCRQMKKEKKQRRFERYINGERD